MNNYIRKKASVSEMNRSLVCAFYCLLAVGLTRNLAAQTFNDSDWIGLGSGVNGQVLALAVSGSNLYVGGIFTTAGGVPATNIAVWNGWTSRWRDDCRCNFHR
jgi:hypothetical protein